jgi:uncharacterized protein YegP (UPF0339 family)
VNTVNVEVLKSRVRRKQPWRWVAKSADNYRVLAISGEWYTNRLDCYHAIRLIFGEGTRVYLNTPDDKAVLRNGHGD